MRISERAVGMTAAIFLHAGIFAVIGAWVVFSAVEHRETPLVTFEEHMPLLSEEAPPEMGEMHEIEASLEQSPLRQVEGGGEDTAEYFSSEPIMNMTAVPLINTPTHTLRQVPQPRGAARTGSSARGFEGSGAGTGAGRGAGSARVGGMRIKEAQIVAVVDVSGSMRRALPAVMRDINRHFKNPHLHAAEGCGRGIRRRMADNRMGELENPAELGIQFWTVGQGVPGSIGVEKLPDIKDFPEREGMPYHPSAEDAFHWVLRSNLVARGVALYWFADFQDSFPEENWNDVHRMIVTSGGTLYIVSTEKEPPQYMLTTVSETGGQYRANPR